eukprot:symbB.v1.2.039714.t1/scaffold6743.1/size15823/2
MAFEKLVRKEHVNLQDFSCLCGDAGSVVTCSSQGLAIMVLAKSGHGFVGWVLEVVSKCIPSESTDTEQILFRPSPTKHGLVIKEITSLEDWLHIPVEPILEGDHAALVLKQVGDAMPLLRLKLMTGLDLTVTQVKLVLQSLGIFLKGAPSKAECYSALANAVAGNQQEAEGFLKMSALKKPAEEEDQEDLQEYSELLDLMEEDLENRNDPDIKGEKKKLAQKKISKPKVDPNGEEITLEPPAKKRGRPKGTGKGKGKGKSAKAKAKPKSAGILKNARAKQNAILDKSPEKKKSSPQSSQPLGNDTIPNEEAIIAEINQVFGSIDVLLVTPPEISEQNESQHPAQVNDNDLELVTPSSAASPRSPFDMNDIFDSPARPPMNPMSDPEAPVGGANAQESFAETAVEVKNQNSSSEAPFVEANAPAVEAVENSSSEAPVVQVNAQEPFAETAVEVKSQNSSSEAPFVESNAPPVEAVENSSSEAPVVQVNAKEPLADTAVAGAVEDSSKVPLSGSMPVAGASASSARDVEIALQASDAIEQNEPSSSSKTVPEVEVPPVADAEVPPVADAEVAEVAEAEVPE